MTTQGALCLIASILWIPCASANTVYDAANDFSTTLNPNGVWSYGESATLGGTFNRYTTEGSFGGVDYWYDTSNLAGDGHNATASTLHNCGSCSVPAGAASFGPGSDNSFSVFRFTVPTTDNYRIAASFYGDDSTGPTSTDVHVLRNGAALFNGNVTAFGTGPSYSTTRSLTAGDTIDFVVGVGADASYTFDTTGLAATITAVPEPSTLALLGLGAVALGWGLRKRRG